MTVCEAVCRAEELYGTDELERFAAAWRVAHGPTPPPTSVEPDPLSPPAGIDPVAGASPHAPRGVESL